MALAVAFGVPASGAPAAVSSGPAPGIACAASAGPPYYSISLATTRNVPGTGLARGTAEVALPAASPFPIGVSADGSYVYDVSISLVGVGRAAEGVLVAWVTSPDLSRVRRLGALTEDLGVTGRVEWNQFLVVVTLEPVDDVSADRWSGPVAFRGVSRSGRMHTMVGHGALQQENCAAWGYGG